MTKSNVRARCARVHGRHFVQLDVAEVPAIVVDLLCITSCFTRSTGRSWSTAGVWCTTPPFAPMNSGSANRKRRKDCFASLRPSIEFQDKSLTCAGCVHNLFVMALEPESTALSNSSEPAEALALREAQSPYKAVVWRSLSPRERLRRSWAMRSRLPDRRAVHDRKLFPKP